MKNQIYTGIAIFVMFLGLAGAGVQAQTPSKVEVNIPFQFSAGNKTLQPGVYSIRQTSANLVVLRNSDGKSLILNAPLSLESKDKGERLVFKRRGGNYYLTQVWLTGESGRQLMPHAPNDKSEHVTIAASLK